MTVDRDDAVQGTPFGERYTLTRKLAVGGMAEIYLARQHGMSGFEKDVVIKCLSRRYADDPRVVEMFLDEARVGALLSHPNVVQVFDVGDHEGQLYIAMEYIEGDELSAICTRGLAAGKFLPLAHACDIVRQAAEGLGYVHGKHDASGEELHVVHRDISPSNLLVTVGGTAKLIDFGIASFAHQRREERGMVPGKYHYMSPEQVKGEKVDARSDVFSLGIVLYEITVGKRLFKGAPEVVMQKIVHDPIKPPTFSRRDFPPALELIVMRALERHAGDRYASAFELAQDLADFIREQKLATGHVRIARYLDELRAAEGARSRPELAALAEEWQDEDDLDFDRGGLIFDGMDDPTDQTKAAPAAEWDDASDPGSGTPRPLKAAAPAATEPTAAPATAASSGRMKVIRTEPAPGSQLVMRVSADDEGGEDAVRAAVLTSALSHSPGVSGEGKPSPVATGTSPGMRTATPAPAPAPGEGSSNLRFVLIAACALALAIAAYFIVTQS